MAGDNVAANAANDATANAAAQGDQDTSLDAAEVNKRLLEESKKHKKLAQDYKSQVDALTKSKLEEQGKEKERADYWQKKHEELLKNLVKDKVKSSVTMVAQKAGAVDPDAVYALGNKDLLKWDDNTLEVEGAEVLVEELKKTKAYLFAPQKTPAINGSSPGGVVKGAQKTLKEMSKDEIMAQLRALKN